MTDWRNWLVALTQAAPASGSLWRSRVDWARLAEHYRTFLPADYRATFDFYNNHTLLSDVAGRDGGPRLEIASPLVPSDQEGHAVRDASGYLWGETKHRWSVAGVSRSADDEWQSHPMPVVPGDVWEWASFQTIGNPTKDQVVWASEHGGRRATVLLSSRKPEAWCFLMSAPELILRLLTGTTGCPWVDGPNASDNDRHLRLEPYPHMDGDEPPADRYGPPGGPWRWEREAPLPAVAGAVLAPLTVKRAAPAEPDDHDSLARLTEWVNPPAEPAFAPDWTSLTDVLGAPAPHSLRELMDLYGSGAFMRREPGADERPYFELQQLGPSTIAALEEEEIDFLETDELGDSQASDPMRAVIWAAVAPASDQQIVVWCRGGEVGFARVSRDGNSLTRLPDDAARICLDALTGTGDFPELAVGDAPSPTLVFRPV